MVSSTLAALPIAGVIKHRGSVKFEQLAQELMTVDPSRFRDIERVEEAVTKYNSCLIYDGDVVRFNYGASRYSNGTFMMERSTQMFLHSMFGDRMKEFALYPFMTRKNSDTCYVGTRWEDISLDETERSPPNLPYPILCDFRQNGLEECTGACGVRQC